MTDFLDTMYEASRERCLAAQQLRSLERTVAAARAMPPPPKLRLHADGFDLIAEVKRTSPALGDLADETDVQLIDRAVAYAHAGAAAVSVLTEPTRFGGDIEHLRAIAAALQPLGVPAMRKDFIVDAYQVWEAAAAGAGGVLLILRLLDDPTVMQMLEAAAQAKMFVLLEAFDRDDLLRAQPFSVTHDNILIGLNARNLETLDVDPTRLTRLAGEFPADCLRVAESGITTADDAARVHAAGYPLALVGTALMRQPSPGELLREMLAAGRNPARA